MYIILLNNYYVTELIECTTLEINYEHEKTSISYDNGDQEGGQLVRVNATFYVVDECVFEIGQNLTNEQLDQLISNDRKNEFLGG